MWTYFPVCFTLPNPVLNKVKVVLKRLQIWINYKIINQMLILLIPNIFKYNDINNKNITMNIYWAFTICQKLIGTVLELVYQIQVLMHLIYTITLDRYFKFPFFFTDEEKDLQGLSMYRNAFVFNICLCVLFVNIHAYTNTGTHTN